MSYHRDLAIKRDCRPPPGELPSLEIKPVSPASPALQADSLPTKPPGKPLLSKKSPEFLQFPLSLFFSRVPVRTPHRMRCSCLMLFLAVTALRFALLPMTLLVRSVRECPLILMCLMFLSWACTGLTSLEKEDHRVRDFTGDPMLKTPPSNFKESRFGPGRGGT